MSILQSTEKERTKTKIKEIPEIAYVYTHRLHC